MKEHIFNISARGYEIDSYGHVNHSVYLNYMEEARWQLLKENNLFDLLKNENLRLFVTEINIRYIKEVKIFDELVIKTSMEKNPPYIFFIQKIYRNNDLVSSAKIKTVFVNSEKIVVDIPKEVISLLN